MNSNQNVIYFTYISNYNTVVIVMLLWIQTCQSPVSPSPSFLSVREAVISRKVKSTHVGAGKWPIMRGPGSALVSAPKVSNVVASSTVPPRREEKVGASSCTVLCASLLFFNRSHLRRLHSVTECARRSNKCARQLKSARVTRKDLRAQTDLRVQMCYRWRDFWLKYTERWGTRVTWLDSSRTRVAHFRTWD